VREFFKSGKNAVLTFGGAYSNHILATSIAGKLFDFPTIGFIRGDELNHESNEMLRAAKANGMQLKFISRSDYRMKAEIGFLKQAENEFGSIFVLPEGGSNEMAVMGAAEIYDHLPSNTEWICGACGTGGTLAGIGRRIKKDQRMLGINVLKAKHFIQRQWMHFNSWEVLPENIFATDDFHFGGYASTTEELINFCDSFERENNFRPDEIYNVKLFFAVRSLAEKGFFGSDKKIVCLNTGGFHTANQII
jgi:1-aminocyclopropane-1-carboxylate deaminase